MALFKSLVLKNYLATQTHQPVQKWLKDRKGRVLDFEDIMHYQRIIKALTETDRVMKEIDLLEVI